MSISLQNKLSHHKRINCIYFHTLKVKHDKINHKISGLKSKIKIRRLKIIWVFAKNLVTSIKNCERY